uniref:Uncharacterized protein n=1 Tax=Nelumbo nucifera TaxID=4432 RepID=A0A822YLV0_NELNU|nr:TPA_asm: hypothetical protein HUJ06_005784 [Nelumbo nucifera]
MKKVFLSHHARIVCKPRNKEQTVYSGASTFSPPRAKYKHENHVHFWKDLYTLLNGTMSGQTISNLRENKFSKNPISRQQ